MLLISKAICYNMLMFTKHLLKVILGFCAMILLGLASLIAINSLSGSQTQAQSSPKMADTTPPKYSVVTLPPIVKKPPCCKTVPKSKSD